MILLVWFYLGGGKNMKNILYFGVGYVIGGMCVGYSIVYLLKKERALYDRNMWDNVSSIS